jgi:glycolate oxidase FAD binding subunit
MPDAIELAPASVEEAAEAMARAARDGQRLSFVGGGTDLGPAGADAAGATDAVLRTRKMARVLEYAPADMVVVAECGVTLAELQAVAAEEGQRLALDPPLPERATLGGLVATGAFGPRRARYGAIRDLVLGVTLVRADGVVARGGGKVVKNVAGFDLPKLACGSLGTLGLIATATFRLHPRPEASVTAIARGVSAAEVVALMAGARAARLEPSAAVAVRNGEPGDGARVDGAGASKRGGEGRYDLGLLFEGFAGSVDVQAARFVELSGGEAPRKDTAFWARHDAVRVGSPLRIKLAALPTRFPAVEALLGPALASLRESAFAWYPSLGVGYLCGDPADGAWAAAAKALAEARAALVASGGWLVVEAAPATPAMRALDRWGPVPSAFPLMRELKARFDPEGRLNPGRFVGGL